MADALTATARLEAAVTRLAEVLERRRQPPGAIPADQVAALSARLDAALGRLRAALHEPEG